MFNRRIFMYCSHKSSVPYQLLPEASRTACSSQDWGHKMRQTWISFSKHSPYDKTAQSLSSFLRYGLSPDLVTIVIPCSLGNGCCTFGFLILIIVERNFLYHSLYILTERPLKHSAPSELGSPCLSFFLSFSLSLSPANSLERRNPSCLLSCPGFQDSLEKAPCAFSPLRGCPVPLWAIQALCQEFYWFSA